MKIKEDINKYIFRGYDIRGVVPTDRVETVLQEGETLTYENDTMLQTAISVVSE